LIKKFIVSVIIVIIHNSKVQLFLIIVLHTLFLALLVLIMPYKNRYQNIIKIISDLSALLIFILILIHEFLVVDLLADGGELD